MNDAVGRGAPAAAGGEPVDDLPDWVVYPAQEWEVATPREAGFDADAFAQWSNARDFSVGGAAGDRPGAYGAVLVRGGKVVATWGDPDHLWSSASVGKLFVKLALQLAADRGRIPSIGALIRDHWTGDGSDGGGQLNHPRKYMTSGHHRSLRFVHLAGGNIPWDRLVVEDSGHTGGFPISNGSHWRNGERVPSWADWHDGDGDAANYCQAEPGTRLRYSSGGMWRLSQALTHVWDADLKEVLDAEIMSKVGIGPHDWSWVSGREAREGGLYPSMPDYASFCDEPHEIRGHSVRGGGGWVVMTPRDLARVGLLLSTSGWWRGQHLIDLHPLHASPGHTGGGGSCLQAYRAWDTIELRCVYAQLTAGGMGLIPHQMDLASMLLGPPSWSPHPAP